MGRDRMGAMPETSAMTLRPYQDDTLTAIQTGWQEGFRKQLAFLPTGAGKTVVFLHEARRTLDSGGSVLILAHRDDLVRQPFVRAQAMGMAPSLEKADSVATADDRLVVASVQSLWNRPERIRRKFDLVIADEAHHSASSKWRKFLDSIDTPESRFLGVTATPHRHDKQNLLDWWDRVAFEVGILPLIRSGYLAQITVQCLPVSITIPKFGAEISAEMADAIIRPALSEIARRVVEATKDRRHIVVFLPLIETSKTFATLLCEHGLPAAHVDGTMKDRHDIQARFRAGELRALCNSIVLTEGWDEPCVDCIVPLRAMQSSSLYQQTVGRGTRLFPGKPDCLLLDLRWQTKRHMARPASLFSGDPELSYLASEMATTRKNLADISDEIGEKLRIAREASLLRAAKREEKRKAFTVSFEDMCRRMHLTPPAPDAIITGPMASEPQLKILRNFKVAIPESGISRANATMLIGRIFSRNPYRRK